MTDRSLTLSAPAKINLYLGVHTERDDRGYHRVDSLMAAVGLLRYRDGHAGAGADCPDGSGIRFSHAKRIRRIGLRLLWPSIMIARQTSA